MNNKNSTYKCWICTDSGMVFFHKYKHKLKYEFAYRCTCIKGQALSSKIMAVPKVLAENIAMENYKNFSKIDQDEISKLKDKISIGSILF